MFSNLSKSLLEKSLSYLTSENSTGPSGRPRANRSSSTPISGTKPGYVRSTPSSTRLEYTRRVNDPSTQRIPGPRRNTGYELAIAGKPVPPTMSFRAREYVVYCDTDAHILKAELVRSMGTVAAGEAFPQLIQLLKWDPDKNPQGHKENNRHVEEGSQLQANPLMSKSVEDFFREDDETPPTPIQRHRVQTQHVEECSDGAKKGASKTRTDSLQPNSLMSKSVEDFSEKTTTTRLPFQYAASSFPIQTILASTKQ